MDQETLEITELPVKKWTKDYKVFLEGFLVDSVNETQKSSNETQKPPETLVLEDIKEYHQENNVCFIIKLHEKCQNFTDKELEKLLKIETTTSLTNMVLFDADGKIQKYSTNAAIINDFFDFRLKVYF